MNATQNATVSGFEGVFGKVLERIRSNANIDLACGESRTIGDTTIIPIGVVAYGFGGGMGTQPPTNVEADSQSVQEGIGGGGGAWIQPIAIVTITDGKTKVIPVLDLARTMAALIGAVGKLALSVSRRAQGRSVFGPGTLMVAPKGRKRAALRAEDSEEGERKG